MNKIVGSNKAKSSATTLIFLGTAIIVLFFNPNLQDPFNAPKLWLLMLLAAALFGYLLFPNKNNSNQINSKLKYTLVIFVVSGFISVVFSKNQLISMLGETQRKNGFATYLSLAIIFYVTARTIKLRDISKFNNYLRLVSVLLVIYGFMQSTGNDFVTWNNPYNSVISTTGNPNFSSAIYAILCIHTVSLTSLSIKDLRPLETLFNFLLSILLFISILNTGSLQGVLAFTTGLMGFILIISFRYKRVFGATVSLFFTVFLTFGVLGMLQIGPLQNYLYKDSVSVRGFYWRAAIEMFKSNPLLGVGLDNYGQFFNIYRTYDYPLRYGFEVTSSNAHNTFLQHFATGGLLFGLSYLILQICVLFYAVKMLTTCETQYLKFILPIFCGWLTFQAQSLVSIDNIAISVLGWLFSAIIIGLGSGSELLKQALSSSSRASGEAKQVITSYVMTILVLIFCTFLFRVETSAIYMRGIYNPSNSENNKLVLENGQKFFTLPFNNINYQNQVGVYLASSGYPNQAVELLKKSLDNTPNSLDTLNVLANIYESAKQPSFAIPYRVKIAELNPWNAKNYLQQGKNYRDIGDFIKMEEMLVKIRSFASSNEVYNIAVTELKKPS